MQYFTKSRLANSSFVKSFGLRLLFASAMIVASISTSIPAHASDATQFFQGLDGSYRGRGKAHFNDGKKSFIVSCQIANKVSANGNKLKISGVCATTQGKAPVRGELNLKGASVSGAFFSPSANMKLTKSWGQVVKNKLTVTSFFIDEQSGALTRIKQIVLKIKGGFTSSISTYNNITKKFQNSGTIKFVKK